MLHGRHCSKTSAGIWHPAQPLQRPEAHEGGALASEASDMWDNPCSLSHSYFVALPQVKNQHLTAPNKRRRLEWRHINVAVAWRDEEAASWVLFLQDTHFAEFPRHFFLAPSHSADELHAVLCRTVSRISITISLLLGESSVSARFCLGAPCWYACS